MLAHRCKKDPFFKGSGEKRVFCLPVLFFETKPLCSAQVSLYSLNSPLTMVSLPPVTTKSLLPGDAGLCESRVYCPLQDCSRDKITKDLIHPHGNAKPTLYLGAMAR